MNTYLVTCEGRLEGSLQPVTMKYIVEAQSHEEALVKTGCLDEVMAVTDTQNLSLDRPHLVSVLK